jgi:hypothetical protein
MAADARTSAAAARRSCKVGELRPSQILTTFGIGSIVDLPSLSVLVMGLDDWRLKDTAEIGEERLLANVREALGPQVQALRSSPMLPESATYQPSPFEEAAYVGIPVAPFPRWMVCPRCRLLSPLSSGLFDLKIDAYRPDRTRYVHQHCTTQARPPTVIPARFVVACKRGHLDDFPWVQFVHQKHQDCRYRLRLHELGASGEARDVEVRCDTCGDARRMVDAFGFENRVNLPHCRGRRPHLRDFQQDGCPEEHVTAMLQGASNSWFAVLLSALSVPQATDKLEQLVHDNRVVLDKVQTRVFAEWAHLRLVPLSQPRWLLARCS